MRMRKTKNLAIKLENYRHLLLEDPKKIKEAFDERPLELEIGFGNGDFLIELAKRTPDRNFLGIERLSDLVYKAARGADKLDNILLMRANINTIIPTLESKLFSGLYLNFSDPWPKPRHYKRRLTYRDLLKEYDRILKEGSQVQFKTDSRLLFDFTLEELKALGKEPYDVSYDLHRDPNWTDNIASYYELKFSGQGNRILGLRYRS